MITLKSDVARLVFSIHFKNIKANPESAASIIGSVLPWLSKQAANPIHIHLYYDLKSADFAFALKKAFQPFAVIHATRRLMNAALSEDLQDIIDCRKRYDDSGDWSWYWLSNSSYAFKTWKPTLPKECHLMQVLVPTPMLLAGMDAATLYQDFAPFCLSLNSITPQTTMVACSLDFDGCLDTINARAYAVKCLCAMVLHYPQITRLRFFIGSARQSVFVDMLNAIKHYNTGDDPNQSCKILGLGFMDDLKFALTRVAPDRAIEVHFDPILTHDVYHGLALGTTFYEQLNSGVNRIWAKYFAAFNQAIAQGFHTVVLVTQQVAQLEPNTWYLLCQNNRFKLCTVTDYWIPVPKQYHAGLQQCLSKHGFWPFPEKPIRLEHHVASQQAVFAELSQLYGPYSDLGFNPPNGDLSSLLPITIRAGGLETMAKRVMDEFKILLIWLHAQHVKHTSEQPFALLLWDDRGVDKAWQDENRSVSKISRGILQQLTGFYGAHPELLPERAHFQGVHFQANRVKTGYLPSVYPMVAGKGKGMLDYLSALERLADSLGKDPEPEHLQQSLIALSEWQVEHKPLPSTEAAELASALGALFMRGDTGLFASRVNAGVSQPK